MKDPNDYIDEIIRDGESSQFEYKNTYWEEMADILNANDARKRARAFILWSSSSSMVLLLAIASWLFLSVDPIYNSRSGQNLASLTPENITHLIQDYQFTHHTLEHLSEHNNSHQSTLATSNVQSSLGIQKETDWARNNEERTTEDVKFTSEMDKLQKIEGTAPYLLAANDVEMDIITKEFDLDVAQSSDDIDRHSVAVYGGGSLAGFTGGEGVTGMDYFAGLGYEFKINKNWSIGAAIQYARKSMNFSKNETYSKYSFRRTDEVMTLNYDQLHNIQMPLSASFHHNKHKITASVIPSYTMAVTTSFQHQKFNHEQDQFEIVEEVQNNYGIDEGIQPFDLQFGLGYEYAITPFMSVGGQVSVGTFDITDNSYWQSETNHTNVDGRAFLKFNLF